MTHWNQDKDASFILHTMKPHPHHGQKNKHAYIVKHTVPPCCRTSRPCKLMPGMGTLASQRPKDGLKEHQRYSHQLLL